MGGSDTLGGAHRFGTAAPDDSSVYGSCAPGWHSACDHETALEQWVSFVKSEGIERVCCLLTGSQLDQEGGNISYYREEFGAGNVCHAPVPDYRLVGEDRLTDTILPFLDESVSQEMPAVVHGLSGIGRTGQVLAAWLVWHHEYDPETAVETVQQRGRDPTQVVDEGAATEDELLSMLGSLEEN